MARALFLAFALLCLFVLSARSEVNVPWPPSSPPDCSTPWEEHGDAYTFCHMDFSGAQNDNLWDGQAVSADLEPCNYNYFLIDRDTFAGGLQFGDWLEVRLVFETSNGTGSTVQLLGGWESVPTEFEYDFLFTNTYFSNTTFSISPYYLSLYPEIWLAVGNFEPNPAGFSTELATYTLTVERYRPSRECDDICLCEVTLGYTQIGLDDAVADDHVVLSGSFQSDANSVRNDIDDVDTVYERMRNFFFTIPSSAYRPGTYLDINITVSNSSDALTGAYLSLGPYAVDPYTTTTQTNLPAFFTSTDLVQEPCVNTNLVPGQQNHLTVPPCDFYYGDYYLSIVFDAADCDTGATYEIIVNVIAPIVTDLALQTPLTNNLQSNIFLGLQAAYSQFDHYQLAVTGTTGRTHAFVRLSSVVGPNLDLFGRTSDQTPEQNAIAFGSFDRVLNPVVFYGDDDSCAGECFSYDWTCSTENDCGCYFIIPSCEFTDDTYYFTVVPADIDNYFVDTVSYHIEVTAAEDSLPVALAPGVPVVATLPVWTPSQVYTFATPNAVDTWAVVELFVRAPSTGDNQLGQPALTLSLQQNSVSYDVCSFEDVDPYKTCTTNNFFEGDSDDGTGLSPTACHIFVDTCRLNSGPIYLVVFNGDEFSDINAFGVNQQQWDYVLWADLETAWALESDVTYTDRIHPDFYNHYYIDVDDSIEAGSWLSVDVENIKWLDDRTEYKFAVYLNYESLAGECPCYDFVDVCTQESTDSSDGCTAESCDPDVFGWDADYGFDLADNEYPYYPSLTDFDTAACRVQATVCSFRPGRWYVSTFAYGNFTDTTSDEGRHLIGYTLTARVHDAPVVNELEFNEQITEQLEPSEIRHFQLTNVDASGDDLVITLGWYEEVISRFYFDQPVAAAAMKAFDQEWGVEARLNFGDLAFEECYEHPWSCKASFRSGGTCQIIVPVCKWAQVDPDQIFVSVRYNRAAQATETNFWRNTDFTGIGNNPVDVLLPEFWLGDAQFNLLVSSERAEVTALAVGTPVYGSVSKDRYAHYSLTLLQTQGLRTDIDVYYNVQTGFDLAEYAPILALNEGSLAGNGRGCRDCFSTVRSCQNNAACHWSFDSCDSLSVDTSYFLSVYKPANAFYDQTLEFALSVSQEDLIIPVALTSEGRTTTTVKLQDAATTRVFFEIDGSSLTPRQSPFDALYITLWANGAYDTNFTAFLNHDGLAGACPCFQRICQEQFNLTTECPITYHDTYDSDYRGALVDFDLEAGSYFVTLEFSGVEGSDAVVITIEADALYYPVYDITPTNLRQSGTTFTLGDFDLPYGELIGGSAPDDYNTGYSMDYWLTTATGAIDWDEDNVFRSHVLNPNNFVIRYRLTPPSRLDDLNWQNLNFYAVTIDSSNTVAGFPMPNRVFIGIDNLHTDYDNCRSVPQLDVSWYGATDLALNPKLDSTVFGDTRQTCSNYELDDRYYYLGQTSTASSGDDDVFFRELPACLFTHAGTATHYFGVEASRFLRDNVEVSEGDGVDTARFRGSVIYDIRFFIQTPIPMDHISEFYTATSGFYSTTIDPPYTTNWQPFVMNSNWPDNFKQRFELDLTELIAGLDAPFVQVVIEHDDALSVTVNGDYAPNFPSRSCWGDCSQRSVLEVRQNSLSADQLSNANIVDEIDLGFTNLTDAASNSQNFVEPSTNGLVYSLVAGEPYVFTLDPCALAQSSVWYFDIISDSPNATFWVYYTTPDDLLDASVTEITAQDVSDRDWVPNTDWITLDGLDDYEFLFINIDGLDLSSTERPRLEIQIDWSNQFVDDVFEGELDQFATIIISRDAPLFLKGEDDDDFPFFAGSAPYNTAFSSDQLAGPSDWNNFDSYIDVCLEPFYVSTVGGAYNSTNDAARNSGRFFLDGCDLAGVSEIWITARQLTAGYRDFSVLARVVADQIIEIDAGISTGYPTTANVATESGVSDAIEPHSFNHHAFQLPQDLQTGGATTLIAELKFPDDDIDRFNGTFYMLFSTDAPAGFTASFTPDNYPADSDGRYNSVQYGGLLTFGSQASADSGAIAVADCYSNLYDYIAEPITFDPLDTGIVPVGEFDSEYRTRRNIDLFNFRYATTLWVSIYFDTVWEELDPETEDDVDGWQGYELRVWLQEEPSSETPIAIERNVSGADVCWLLSTETGVEPNSFDYNITWSPNSDTPTWFAFELTEDLVSLDCSDLASDECLFSQWLEFQIFNDEINDWTYGGEQFVGYDSFFTVYGPARYNIGGAGDMYTPDETSDIIGGKWTIQDSHIGSGRRRASTTPDLFDTIGTNSSSNIVRFFPCASASSSGEGYGIDTDWSFNDAFMAPSTVYSLRPGTYYIPIWTADSLDFEVCVSLNSFNYDTTWINPAAPYVPDEITADYIGNDADGVDTLAQFTKDIGDGLDGNAIDYQYFWFHLDDNDFDEGDYLQVWLDQVLFCSDIDTCSSLPSTSDIILQMFRSDCQLWTCQADGKGPGCEGRFEIGSADLDNLDFFFDDVSRFILGGAGLSPCSLTSGDFFIKVSLPDNATYTLSVYLRSPPTTLALTAAVAARSTIYLSAFQHYTFTSADSDSLLLTGLEVTLNEVACGTLELFAKRGSFAGPFFPSEFDRNTFIGSQMYNPATIYNFDFGTSFPFSPDFQGSLLEKCSSAYCTTNNSDTCSIVFGTTELAKDLDATGLIGSTIWYFSVHATDSVYHTDNDEADVFGGSFTSFYGDGFFEPVTYFITATPSFSEVTSVFTWGCGFAPESEPVACFTDPEADDNIPVYNFGFHTVTLFTDAFVSVDTETPLFFLNATVEDVTKPAGPASEFVEPVVEITTSNTWEHVINRWSTLSTDGIDSSNFLTAGPKNIFVTPVQANPSFFADFYHHPVLPAVPGVIYSSTGRDPSFERFANRFIDIHYAFYEFSPALTSTPSFSLNVFSEEAEDNCIDSTFWIDTECGQYDSQTPSNDHFWNCASSVPRFLSLRLDTCTLPCSGNECSPFRYELGYQTSLDITELELGVESCGSSWSPVQFTEQLVFDDTEWLIFSLPVDAQPSTATVASWLVLDFYPSLASYGSIYTFETDSLFCSRSPSSGRRSSFEQQASFFCPDDAFLVAYKDSFVQDYSISSITPSIFEIPVVASGTVSSNVPLSIPVAFSDFARFDLQYQYAVYSFVVPETLDTTVSTLSVSLDPSPLCRSVDFDWWLNFDTPVPRDCASLPSSLAECEFAAGTYFVSIWVDSYVDASSSGSDNPYPEWSAVITVDLEVLDVLPVPEDGTFSESFTIQPGQSIYFQTTLSRAWLDSHPALQNEILYRIISPLGQPTLFGSQTNALSSCFDCAAPTFTAVYENVFNVPFEFTVQFELLSDLLLNFDPSVVYQAYDDNYAVGSTTSPLWFVTRYQPLLAPYFDQRSAIINNLPVGDSVSATLYNAFTYRQLQVYQVSTVAANAIGQIRLSNVVGGIASAQVFPAALSLECAEFKECHSAPLFDVEETNHEILQTNPIDNTAGSCSIIYSPCEWAASSSYFVVVHDHVFNNPVTAGEVFQSPEDRFTDWTSGDDTWGYGDFTDCFPWGCSNYVPTQNNPFEATQFTLTVTEEFYATASFPTATESFTSRPNPSDRSAFNPAGNWQHFFYSYEASDVSSLVISVEVTASDALATSGVWVTVSDSDCGCSDFVRNIWCSAEYPSWLCEIEIPTHADHPLSSTTFYIDVYGLKGSFSLDVSEGFDNCVFSDGEDFCSTRVLNYAYWPSASDSELDGKASCLYDTILPYFEDHVCSDCAYEITDECKLALMDYTCAASFQPCDVNGFIDATICVDKCTAVESACPYSFIEAGLPTLDCGNARYSTTNCF